MLYFTGDTHSPDDIKKLNNKNFPIQKKLTKEDMVVIAGDYGGVWDNSKSDKYWIDWLDSKNFTTLFVDGNHENFDLLYQYPIEYWNGGKVHFVAKNVIHLMRGQVYNIDGYKVFTMGGGYSTDRFVSKKDKIMGYGVPKSMKPKDRKEGYNWWSQEQPSDEEYEEAINNLEKHDWKVDIVITHTASNILMNKIETIKEKTKLNDFFDMLHVKLEYKHWYMGHFHKDLELDDKHTFLFNEVRMKRI